MFASKADCSKFYIGITNDLKRRRREHERERPEYTLMCAIYKEEINIVSDSFHNLEATAVAQFRAGVVNKATGRVLRCGNDVSGSPAKNWLYLLVDKRDVSDIPVNSRDAAMWATKSVHDPKPDRAPAGARRASLFRFGRWRGRGTAQRSRSSGKLSSCASTTTSSLSFERETRLGQQHLIVAVDADGRAAFR